MSEIVPYVGVGPAVSSTSYDVEGLEYNFSPGDKRFKGRYNVYSNKYDVIRTIRSNMSSHDWDKLCKGCFGTTCQVGDGLQLHGALVHTIMMHEVKTEKLKELWFKVSGDLVRFSLLEFAAITCLRCSEEFGHEILDVAMEYVLGVNKCTLTDLKDMFCKEKDKRKKLMLAHLLV